METVSSKTKSTQEQSIDCVDWDLIDNLLSGREMPEGAVTCKMIQEKYGIGQTAARERMKTLVDSGMFTRHEHWSGCTKTIYLLQNGGQHEPAR